MITNPIAKLSAALALAASLAFAQKQPQPKSQKEVEALQAMFNAQSPDARLAAAENLLSKFADTEFKSIALYFMTVSAEEKGDFEKLVVYGERTLQADPKNYATMLILARNYAQKTREFDLDKEEKLGKSEKYAKDALAALATAPKPRPDLSDDDWANAKKDFEAQAHEALGMSAVVRKNYDLAIKEFQTAISTAAQPDPTAKIRMASAMNLAGKHDDAIKTIDEVLADPQLNPSLRQFATNEKLKAAQAKGGAK
jgi:hypothetical protein